MGKQIINLSGQKFNRWTFIEFDCLKNKQYYWKCQCDCGNIKSVRGSDIKNNSNKSCGCYNTESTIKFNIETKSTHRLTKTTEYKSWTSMKGRCYNLKDKDYKNYGARGIIVCDRWKNSFENFLADMGNKPSNLYTIDRINNNGNYEISNCKWSTSLEQANNTRYNRKVKNILTGEIYNSIKETSRKTGISIDSLTHKLKGRCKNNLNLELV